MAPKPTSPATAALPSVAAMPVLGNPAQAAQWLRTRVTGRLQADSRQVRAGDAFIAWPGAATDGRRHVPAALAQGAVACLVEQDGVAAWVAGFGEAGAAPAVAAYAQLKAATGPIAAEFYAHPSRELALLAVTGTNGKTSTAWWIAQALASAERAEPMPCAVVGTLGIGVPPALVANGLTTPDPVTLQHGLRTLVQQGIRACAIEASSIGLAERRLDGCAIRVAVFTNLTHDHLDYHGSMESYWQAKAELFRWPGLQAAVVNVDDPQGVELAAQLGAFGPAGQSGQAAPAQPSVDVWTYGLAAQVSPACPQPRLQADNVHYTAHGSQGERYGLCFEVWEGPDRHALQTGLIGQYNVANLLAVIGTLRALGLPLGEAVRVCRDLSAVPGRMECLGGPGQPLAVIDYAHTPDALDKALSGLRQLAVQRGGQLWCVFGCGGERDPSKRPMMAAVAEKNADQVVVTSDNPRREKPSTIISQILLGLNHGLGARDHVHVEPDRALAIAHALQQAGADDIVLIAGKGHEDYQDVAGAKHPFSDQAHARAALAQRGVAEPPLTTGSVA